ncbi:translation initiation factor IF-2 [Candidatus Magnetaquicoccus inordinatus]|uniref:translation initiation factor IF-2 n=1 Tax=Candidatus Magnetaquicoccus inordinatus TaxID=2496818 RepID=UPI00102B55EB|nr:translation initiation factor IF-2 [Candidatus Magnetaquicoccus inordinatus]
MSDIKKGDGEDEEAGMLRLSAPRRIVLKKTVEGGSIRQNFSHGRSKSVVVEVRKKRTFVKAGEEGAASPENTTLPAGSAALGDDRAAALRSTAPAKQILAPISSEERAILLQQQEEQRAAEERQRQLELEQQERERQLELERQRERELQAERERQAAAEAAAEAERARAAKAALATPEPETTTPQQEVQERVAAPIERESPVVSTPAPSVTVQVREVARVSFQDNRGRGAKESGGAAEAPSGVAGQGGAMRMAASVKSGSSVTRRDVREERPQPSSGKPAYAGRGEAPTFRREGSGGPAREGGAPFRREEGAHRRPAGGGAPRREGGESHSTEEPSYTPRREGREGSSYAGRSGSGAAPGMEGGAGRGPSRSATGDSASAGRPAGAARRIEKPVVVPAELDASGDLASGKKMTRAQREDVARKKTDALVAKRLSQLDEMRRQKQEVDEKRKLDNVVPSPARVTLKAGRVKYKGKAIIEEDEKQVPMRRSRSPAAKNKFARREDAQSLGPVIREVIVPDMITVGDLAARMAVKSSEVIKRLMAQGMMLTINQVLDQETAVLVVEEMGHKAKMVSEAAAIDAELSDTASADDALQERPPVVTVMGHVDHGKTSLLDAIRKSDVASREFGGITQHIGAYQVTMANGASITFLDTPGHAAFTAMRARGAHVTDIVVLVVAADDGVMPQTTEAINHAKEAKVPIVVAINKIDKQGINIDRVTQQLADHGLVPEDWGGETIFVKVSAHTGEGIETLEEMILLQAEVLGLQADVAQRARGAIIEAKLDKGRGPVATCLVQNGTLKVGDIFVAGTEWGKIRSLIDDKGRMVSEALPAMPVEIIGFSGIPEAGDDLVTVPDERRAKEIAAFRMRKSKERGQAKHTPQMDDIFDQIHRVESDEVRVIIKGDVRGSVEAVAESLQKIVHELVRVNVIHVGVGGINESDVMLAAASDAIIVGFNIRADAKSRDLAKREQVDIRFYTVIYDLMDDITQALEGKLKPLVEETVVGRAKVRELFRISKVGLVAGCMVIEGTITRKSKVRLLRDNAVIYTGDLQALKRFKDDAKEVREGMECGICLDKFSDIKENDIIEAFTSMEVRQTIDR